MALGLAVMAALTAAQALSARRSAKKAGRAADAQNRATQQATDEALARIRAAWGLAPAGAPEAAPAPAVVTGRRPPAEPRPRKGGSAGGAPRKGKGGETLTMGPAPAGKGGATPAPGEPLRDTLAKQQYAERMGSWLLGTQANEAKSKLAAFLDQYQRTVTERGYGAANTSLADTLTANRAALARSGLASSGISKRARRRAISGFLGQRQEAIAAGVNARQGLEQQFDQARQSSESAVLDGNFAAGDASALAANQASMFRQAAANVPAVAIGKAATIAGNTIEDNAAAQGMGYGGLSLSSAVTNRRRKPRGVA